MCRWPGGDHGRVRVTENLMSRFFEFLKFGWSPVLGDRLPVMALVLAHTTNNTWKKTQRSR